ncbi:flagellar protein FlaG [Jeotgalibacillus salarius]|nr:flagellar protein FlaG [Jeotgalibacillus salarius]
MKIQVASNASINPELLNKIVQEREPFKAPGIKEGRVDQVGEAIERGKLNNNGLETAQEIQRKVDQTNKLFEVNYTSVKFSVHEGTERMMIRVVDQQTDEVIREIPSEDFLDMVSKMVDYMGLMVDKKI